MNGGHETAILSQWVGWLLLAILGALWVYLGVLWGRKAKNMEGYMVAGRNVGLALGAATAMATWVTSNTTMLAPEFGLRFGVWGMLSYSTACFGLFFFAPMARRIRRLMPNGLTSGDFIRLRYGKPAWIVFLIITMIYSFAWLVTMAMAGGLFMNAISGIPFELGMTVVLLVCVLYTLFGGLYAVIGTDFIQSVIILVGVVLIGAFIYQRIDFDSTYTQVLNERPAMLSILLPGAIIAFFNSLLFGMGEIFHNNVWWSRAFAMRSGVAVKAYMLGGLFWLPIPIAVGFVALASGTLGINIPRPDMLGPIAATEVLGATGAVVIFIILFCSLASSIDSLLAATSDLVTEDIYRKGINPNAGEGTVRKASILIIIGLGFLTWIVCMLNPGTLAQVLFASGGLVGATIWPIAGGLFWKKINRTGAFLAMLLGAGAGLAAYFTIGVFSGAVVGSAVSMVITLGSTLFRPNVFNWAALNEPDEELKKPISS